MQEGFGTSDVATERTLTYSANDMLATLKDAENNLTTFEYDGFDRWSKTRYPVPAKGGNASSTTDYEQALAYDANSSVTSFRNRAGQAIGFGYDNLNRVKSKDLPGTEPDVAYAYDNLDRLTAASQSGNALSFGYDALSRKTSEGGPLGTTTFGTDLAGRRTSVVYPREAQNDCRMFTSLQVLRLPLQKLIFITASTQRKEVIRCLMVQQGGRKGVFARSDR